MLVIRESGPCDPLFDYRPGHRIARVEISITQCPRPNRDSCHSSFD